LGIQGASNLDLALIEALRIPNNTRGVVVSRVEQGGPAALAGLKSASKPTAINGENVPTSADIITAIDGKVITDMSGLVSYLAINTEPGQQINLTVLRDGQMLTIPVTLAARPTSN
jgi:S1-C subfamily serine protease